MLTAQCGNHCRLQAVLRGRYVVVGIVGVVVMEKIMGKRTDNEENLKRYQERLSELQKNGDLVPSPELPTDKLIQHLAAEGEKLLMAEAKVNRKIAPKKSTDETKLTNALGLSSKNPYIRARVMVLQKYSTWRQKEIARMEQHNDINNKFYLEFVKAVADLGDQLSNKK